MKPLLMSMIGGAVALLIIALVAYLSGYDEIAVAILTLLVALTHLIAFGSGVAFSHFVQRDALLKGAEIVIRSMDSNDRWDAAKMQTAAGLFKTGAEYAARQGNEPPPPIVQMLPDSGDWLDQSFKGEM